MSPHTSTGWLPDPNLESEDLDLLGARTRTIKATAFIPFATFLDHPALASFASPGLHGSGSDASEIDGPNRRAADPRDSRQASPMDVFPEDFFDIDAVCSARWEFTFDLPLVSGRVWCDLSQDTTHLARSMERCNSGRRYHSSGSAQFCAMGCERFGIVQRQAINSPEARQD